MVQEAAWTQACKSQFPWMELADLLQTDIRKLEGDRIPLPKMDDVTGTIGGPFILQIVSVIDGTKPSSKQHIGDGGQERVLLLRVTDGTSSKFTAIEMVRLPKLSTDTPPGTKLLVSDVRYVKHKLLLQPCSVLGVEGVVEALANNFRSSRLLEQQYKLSKDLQVKKKNAAGEGPPAFDAFKPDASKSGNGAGGEPGSGHSQGKSKSSMPHPSPATIPLAALKHADVRDKGATIHSSCEIHGPSSQGRGGQNNHRSSRGRDQTRGCGTSRGRSSSRGDGTPSQSYGGADYDSRSSAVDPLPPSSSYRGGQNNHRSSRGRDQTRGCGTSRGRSSSRGDGTPSQSYGGADYDSRSSAVDPLPPSSSYRGGGRGEGGSGYSSRSGARGSVGGRGGGRGQQGDRGWRGGRGRGGRRGGRGGGYGPSNSSSSSAEPSVHSLEAHFQINGI